MKYSLPLLAVIVIVGCRGQPTQTPRNDLASLIDSLKPSVERAAGLKFRAALKAETQTREQLKTFLLEKIDEDLPPERLEGIESAYKLLGLLPDSMRLQNFLVDILTEQVAGFYDPRSETLYGMEGYDRDKMRLIMAHEMVHALQDQYLPLDSILRPQEDDDRQTAAQAILEGQATIASIKALIPPDAVIPREMWTQARDMLAETQAAMPLFSGAPLVIKEQLLFPYLSGADFMMWWATSPYADTLPFGPRMPESTEQIVQPIHYEDRDQPRAVRFSPGDSVLFENTMGDLGLRILAASLVGAKEIAGQVAIGWGGDRFRVYRTSAGPALVWVIVWDSPVAANRFAQGNGAMLAARSRANYRTELAKMEVEGASVSRIVIAPIGWGRWTNLPAVRIDTLPPPTTR